MTHHTPVDTVSRLDSANAYIRERSSVVPRLAVVAGSGLGALAGLVDADARLPYADIPGMTAPSVQGHAGELVLGTLEGLPVAVLSGRVHLYEGHSLEDVVFGVRLLGRLGTQSALLTNAAGGILPHLQPGSLLRIVDHLNFTGRNPLIGPNIETLGPRFPDMSTAYCPRFGEVIDSSAARAGIELPLGVYAGMAGPSYETPAEIRMLSVLGAAVVGMSTVHETIALRHMGVQVGGISVVSNAAAGLSDAVLDHQDVKDVALSAGPLLLALVKCLARDLGGEEHAKS